VYIYYKGVLKVHYIWEKDWELTRLILFYLYMKKIQFKAKGYLKTTRMGNDGEKITSFEHAASEALEVAKLELMSRDQSSPTRDKVLLIITAEVAHGQNRPTKQKRYNFTKEG